MHWKHLLGGLLLMVVLVSPSDVAESATITAVGGSAEQQQRVAEAVAAFDNAGLELPDLDIGFSADAAKCLGHMGLFDSGQSPWRITICSDAAFVYAHELAHAWELANLTEETRRQFMELRGHLTWIDPAVPWIEQGAEGVAFIIQQGLLDRPLPPTLSAEMKGRLAAFELLTGSPSPRLEPTS